jgi:DNA mismatch repair protein MutS
MVQFFEAKSRQPDALLFFRMGDFYELFFEDAEKAAAALGIALTKRGKHAGAGDPPWPACPVHAGRGLPRQADPGGLQGRRLRADGGSAEARKRGSKSVVRPRRGAAWHARHR